jgi:hypothetical protein
MKLTERLLQEIDALETARRTKSDMDDYMHDFVSYTSQEVLEALKMARMEIIRLQVKEVAKNGQVNHTAIPA